MARELVHLEKVYMSILETTHTLKNLKMPLTMKVVVALQLLFSNRKPKEIQLIKK